MAPPPYSLSHPSMRLVLRILESRKMNQIDVASWLRVHRQTAKYVLDWLYKHKQIRIFSWERKSGAPLPRYTLGHPKLDACRPVPYNRSQHMKRARLGLQGDGSSKLKYEAEKQMMIKRRRAAKPRLVDTV